MMLSQQAVRPRSNSLSISLGVFALWVLLIVGGQKVFFPNAADLDDLVKSQINPIFVIAVVLLLGVTFFGLLSGMSIWQAILLTAFLFGAVHALNGFLTGNFSQALVQAVMAMMSGLWFQAVRLHTRSIYPAMLFHSLWDFREGHREGVPSLNTLLPTHETPQA